MSDLLVCVLDLNLWLAPWSASTGLPDLGEGCTVFRFMDYVLTYVPTLVFVFVFPSHVKGPLHLVRRTSSESRLTKQLREHAIARTITFI